LGEEDALEYRDRAITHTPAAPSAARAGISTTIRGQNEAALLLGQFAVARCAARPGCGHAAMGASAPNQYVHVLMCAFTRANNAYVRRSGKPKNSQIKCAVYVLESTYVLEDVRRKKIFCNPIIMNLAHQPAWRVQLRVVEERGGRGVQISLSDKTVFFIHSAFCPLAHRARAAARKTTINKATSSPLVSTQINGGERHFHPASRCTHKWHIIICIASTTRARRDRRRGISAFGLASSGK
jgi:hypothetical protein